MSDKLERYLEEIDRYLAVKRNSKEILAEIRSHILEKAADECGGVSEGSIEKAIASFGKPREVASRYLEGAEIIAPAFRKHLFRYTWILFAAHCVGMAASIFFDRSIAMFPFFIIPRMPAYLWIFYVPMAFIADFGLVAFILLLVTQRKQDLKLPWPKLFVRGRNEGRLARPTKRSFIVLLALFAAATFLVVRYGTLFFYTINGGPVVSLLHPVSSLFFSLLFLAMLACGVIALGVRFIVNSAWVNLARDAVVLLLLWIVWNSPIAPQYRDVQGVDLAFVGGVFVFLITAIAAVRFVRSLVQVTREMAFAGAAEESSGQGPRRTAI